MITYKLTITNSDHITSISGMAASEVTRRFPWSEAIITDPEFTSVSRRTNGGLTVTIEREDNNKDQVLLTASAQRLLDTVQRWTKGRLTEVIVAQITTLGAQRQVTGQDMEEALRVAGQGGNFTQRLR